MLNKAGTVIYKLNKRGIIIIITINIFYCLYVEKKSTSF